MQLQDTTTDLQAPVFASVHTECAVVQHVFMRLALTLTLDSNVIDQH